MNEEMANYAANKALRKLGVREGVDWETISPAAQLPFDVGDGGGYFENNGNHEYATKISNGDIIKVVIDGTEYVCPASGTVNGKKTDVFIGRWGDTNKHLPFLVWFELVDGEGWLTIEIHNSVEPTHTIALYKQTETIHPISDKYLPGVCLPVVELSAETLLADSSSSEVTLTPAESEQMEKAFVTGLPCVIKLKIVEDGNSHVFSCIASLCLIGGDSIMLSAYMFTLQVGDLFNCTVARGLNGGWFRPQGT